MVRLLVNSRLLVVKFWGSQKVCADFLLPLNSAMFKGQLYISKRNKNVSTQMCVWMFMEELIIHNSQKRENNPNILMNG